MGGCGSKAKDDDVSTRSLRAKTRGVTVAVFCCLLFCNCSSPIKNIDNAASIPMVWVPGGTFVMGSPSTEPHRNADEAEHLETLTDGFWLGETEVTIGQWQAVMSEGIQDIVTRVLTDKREFDFGDGVKKTVSTFMNMNPDAPAENYLANAYSDLPVYFISWYDAMDFCKTLTAKEKAAGRLPKGYVYTLPTEVQWEYAARAGTTTASYAGNFAQDEYGNANALNEIAWYSGTSETQYPGKTLNNTNAGPRRVAQKAANAWGLYDMLGNVWEWCLDWYVPSQTRVNRGGSWGSWASSERAALRAGNPPAEASAYRGFRVALVKQHKDK